MWYAGRVIRVLIAEDHQIVREGLRSLLRAEKDLEVLGETGDGGEVVALAEALRPDVVLMDIALKGLSGVEAIRRLGARCPGLPAIVLSMYDDPATVERALGAGARGYVVKGRGVDSLCEAIRAVCRGETWLSPELSRHLRDGRRAVDPLSLREREILELLAEGLTGPQIAERLGLRPKTIENHRARIMEKLGVHTTAALVRYAFTIGLAK